MEEGVGDGFEGGVGNHDISGRDGSDVSERLFANELSESSMYMNDWSMVRSKEVFEESCVLRGSKFLLIALARAASRSS